MNNKEIYERLLQCARSDHKDWRKCDKLTEFEQEVEYHAVLEGIRRAALFLLPTDDYFRWCKERLPEQEGWYIVTEWDYQHQCWDTSISEFHASGGWGYGNDKVIAWMPMPEIYKEDS